MRKLLPALLFSLALSAGDRPKLQKARGTITAKGSLASYLTLNIQAPGDDREYICVIETPDLKFREYKTGDLVSVEGYAKNGEHGFRRCVVMGWTQREEK